MTCFQQQHIEKVNRGRTGVKVFAFRRLILIKSA